jgi:hypothetical protein
MGGPNAPSSVEEGADTPYGWQPMGRIRSPETVSGSNKSTIPHLPFRLDLAKFSDLPLRL